MFISDKDDPEAMQELKEEFRAEELGRKMPPRRWPRREEPTPPAPVPSREVYAEEPDC